MKSHSALYKFTIAAGATINLNATGRAIFVRVAPQVFRITLDGGQTIDAEEGFEFISEEKERFTRMELNNPNTENLEVEIYVSDGTVRRGSPRFSREAPTKIFASGAFNVGTVGLFDVTNTKNGTGVGKHRLQVAFFNPGPNKMNLFQISTIGGADGAQFGFILAGGAVTALP